MSHLAHQRCFLHIGREAVAKCPECGRMYCRECVTEHGDRMLCAACIRSEQTESRSKKELLPGLLSVLHGVFGLLLCLLFFYGISRFLVTMPAPYHEGTEWRSTWEKLNSAAQGGGG